MFEAIARRLGNDFLAVALSPMEANRHWDLLSSPRFELHTLPGRQLFFRGHDWALHLNRGLRAAVRRHAPDVVVVCGYDELAYWAALLYAKRHGAGTVLWMGSHRASSRHPGGLWAVARRRFVTSVDSVFAYGTLAARYARELGAPHEVIVTGTNAVECSRFFPDAARREAKRRELDADGKVIVLYSGQLIRRKGLAVVIEAMKEVPRDAQLLVVGDGPDRRELEATAARMIPGRFRFLGHRSYDELPAFYAASDIFVMPSEIEVWGLVLNEAMAAGLPVVSSTTAGATADLVVGRRTGFPADPRSIHAWSEALRTLVGSPDLRREMGSNAQALVRPLDTNRYADELIACAEFARSRQERVR